MAHIFYPTMVPPPVPVVCCDAVCISPVYINGGAGRLEDALYIAHCFKGHGDSFQIYLKIRIRVLN